MQTRVSQSQLLSLILFVHCCKKHPEIESQIFCKSYIILTASLCSVDLYCVKLLQIFQINIPSVSCKTIEVTSLST